MKDTLQMSEKRTEEIQDNPNGDLSKNADLGPFRSKQERDAFHAAVSHSRKREHLQTEDPAARSSLADIFNIKDDERTTARQKWVLVFTSLFLILAILFPPYKIIYKANAVVGSGLAFILDLPNFRGYSAQINVQVLLIELGVIIAVGSMMFLLYKK
jgi:hypothetical protein